MRIDRLMGSMATAAGMAVMAGTLASCLSTPAKEKEAWAGVGAERAQVPTWSADDMRFFLHGSMSTEVVPEAVLKAFEKTYPDIFPTEDFSHLGAVPDPAFGWPIGFSRGKPEHLGGLTSIGVNCAACHVTEVESSAGHGKVRILGVTSLFNAEGFFNSVLGSGFKTQDPENMRKFLAAYLDESNPETDPDKHAANQMALADLWEKQADQIKTAMAADPAGAKDAGPGGLQKITAEDLRVDSKFIADGGNLADLSVNMLKLFHNMRVALHVPDQLPATLPPPSGPGRNDAFGLLSAALFNSPQPSAPVKYGLVWNVDQRQYVHWDGNTQSPIARNVLAAVGLGAPLVDKHANMDFVLIERQTKISEKIMPPKYPFAIDREAAARGAELYGANCASCHNGAEGDNRLYGVDQVGTDPVRAQLFTQAQADKFNDFLATLETQGYVPPNEPGIRSTQKYWAPSLAGVWARSPYLHNGSVRTMYQLLTPPTQRATSFHRGSNKFDEIVMGYTDEGYYLMDIQRPANSNSGHDFGTGLTDLQKRDLMEYLKTL
jgi:hypothetical protein